MDDLVERILTYLSEIKGAGSKAAKSDLRQGAGYALATAVEITLPGSRMDPEYVKDYVAVVKSKLGSSSSREQAIDSALRYLMDSPVKKLHKIKRSTLDKFLR